MVEQSKYHYDNKREIERRFTYHAPNEKQIPIYHKIRELAKNFVYYIYENVPDGREKSLAITKLEEVVMWANAAIARRSE